MQILWIKAYWIFSIILCQLTHRDLNLAELGIKTAKKKRNTCLHSVLTSVALHLLIFKFYNICPFFVFSRSSFLFQLFSISFFPQDIPSQVVTKYILKQHSDIV